MLTQTSVDPTYSDTTGGASHTIVLPSVNFGADFRIASSLPDQLDITNLTTPLGFSEIVTFQNKPIADIYANTSVDKALYAASRKGRKLYLADNTIWRVTDSDDASFELALPIGVSITVKYPQNSFVTTNMIMVAIARCISMLYETDGITMEGRVNALIRGSLKPKDL